MYIILQILQIFLLLLIGHMSISNVKNYNTKFVMQICLFISFNIWSLFNFSFSNVWRSEYMIMYL